MNLENKIVSITGLSVSTYPPETKATVSVSEEVVEGVFKSIGTFEMKFSLMFHSANDPSLLNLVYEKLTQIP